MLKLNGKEEQDKLVNQQSMAAENQQNDPAVQVDTPATQPARAEAKERTQTFTANRTADSSGRISTEGLDQNLVDQAFKGQMFGEKDYARYLALKGEGGGAELSPRAEAAATEPEANVTEEATKDNTAGLGKELDATFKPLGQQGDPRRLRPGQFSPSEQKGFTNFESGQALKNQMEEDYSFSARRTKDMATNSINQADKDVNYSTQVRGLNDAVNKKTDYYRSRTDMQTLGLFGDIWNTKPYDWKSPQAPEKIETTYSTDTSF